MGNEIICIVVSVFLSQILTYFTNKQLRKNASSESDILVAISTLVDDVYYADSGLAVISRDICGFFNSGTNLVDDHTANFSSKKIKLERDWSTYGYHFKNKKIISLMSSLLNELNKTNETVISINDSKGNDSKRANGYTFYSYDRDEVKELCSLLNAERKKIVK